MTQFRDMAQAICDAIETAAKKTDRPSSLSAFVEDKLDNNFIIDSNLAKNALCVVVGLESFDRRESAGPMIYGTARFNAVVFESVAHREEGSLTAQEAGEWLMEQLHWTIPSGAFETPLRLVSARRADDNTHAIMNLTFTANAVIGEEASE